ncbi:hypothetical protein ZTR_10354 [Talaromyces verruculosus]|nr:hypothetical protein ZTR_10354 [Talaromyces verruculosus]
MKGAEGLSNEFKDVRHDRSKTDNVRTAFKNNLWLIQKIVNTVQVVGNAASAFPPAMPASLIFKAFGQVMQSFATVSADYDKIMGSSGGYQEYEEAVNELTQAVGLATLRTVEILNDIVQSMNGNVEFLVARVTLADERTKAIKSDTGIIIEQNQELKSKQDAIMEMLNEQSRIFNDATSLLKLGVVRLRLARWGQSVGLANVVDVKSLQMMKLLPQDRRQLQDLLSRILELFVDAEVVLKRFKKRNGNSAAPMLDPAKELDRVSTSLHQKMQDLVKNRQGKSELEQDEWTIYDEKNFTRLIEDINELVDGLVELFPGIQEEQRRLWEKEVSEMNTNENILPLLKEVACDQDKLLSDTVIKVIRSTTTYTNSVVVSGPNSGLQIGNNSGKISGVRFSSS